MIARQSKCPSERVHIIDATLREGCQAPGVSFDERACKEVAWLLEAIGVDTVECGHPAVSDAEKRRVETVRSILRSTELLCHARAARRDIRAAADVGADWVGIFLGTNSLSLELRALWMLEEIGQPYELRFIDILAGEQKQPELLALNPMGKLPTLTDGATVVTESAAIGLYLADRYAPGTLAPAFDDPRRATYLRWSLFSPSVIEPGLMAKLEGWSYRQSSAGWGSYDSMILAMKNALRGDYVLGDQFSMADVIFGGTVRYMLMVKLLESDPVFTAYAERLSARPALQRADARNAEIVRQRGLAG